MKQSRKTHTSSLRIARDATRLSQTAFASEVGTARAVIENVEMGRSRLTRELSQRIAALIGVDRESLYTPVPLDLAGRPYTTESWLGWQRTPVSDETASRWIEQAKTLMIVAFNAAHRNPGGVPTPHKVKAFYCSFSDWLIDMAGDLKIKDGMEKIIEGQFSQTHPRYSATLGAVRRALAHNAVFQTRDNPQWTDDTMVEVEEIVTPLLVPLTRFISNEGMAGIAEQRMKRRTMKIILPGGMLFQVSEHEMDLDFFGAHPEMPQGTFLTSRATPPGHPSPGVRPPQKPPTGKAATRGKAARKST